MYHCGITEREHDQALGEYVVPFRRRSPAHPSYHHDKKYPENFSPEVLVGTVRLKDLVDGQFQGCVKEAQKVMQ